MSENKYESLDSHQKRDLAAYDSEHSKAKVAITSVGFGLMATALIAGIPAIQVTAGGKSLSLNSFLAIGAGVVFGIGVAYGAYKEQVKDLNKLEQENSLLSEDDLIDKKLKTMKSIKAIRAAALQSNLAKSDSRWTPAEIAGGRVFSSKYQV